MNVNIKQLQRINPILYLIAIGVSGFIIRLYYFPYNIPITEDGLFYFRYAIDTSILGHFPSTSISNNGWPLLVSVFFSVYSSTNFLDYMTLQRLLSVSISVLTIIPVYLLAKRFFDIKYALVASFLFAFEPRTIQNSLLGISEPAYIILITFSLFFFLSDRLKIIYLSFCFAALATIIRYEGVMLFFVISIMFFIRNKHEKNRIRKYLLATTIFVLTLVPMMYARTISFGDNGITSSLIGGSEVYGIEAVSSSENRIFGVLSFVFTGISTLAKFMGWSMIPYFIVLVPFGIYFIFRNRNSSRLTLILSVIFLSIPAFYAYSRGIQEIRYLYVLYPIFCVFSVFAIKFVITRKKQFIIPIIIGIIATSIFFLVWKSIDYEHERDAFDIAKSVSSRTSVINEYYPESKYVRVTGMIEKFPILSNNVSFGPKILPTSYDSMYDFIESNRKEGLTHVVADGAPYRPVFLRELFSDETKYPFLIKEFESTDMDSMYKVKIFRVDYDKFDLLN